MGRVNVIPIRAYEGGVPPGKQKPRECSTCEHMSYSQQGERVCMSDGVRGRPAADVFTDYGNCRRGSWWEQATRTTRLVNFVDGNRDNILKIAAATIIAIFLLSSCT